MRPSRFLPSIGTIAAAALAWIPVARAHPVTVDGATGDWLVRQSAFANSAIVARSLLQTGELVWRDAPGDERTDFTAALPDAAVDLQSFAVTADPTNLYFRIETAGPIVGAPVIGAPQFQIAIDLDRTIGSGTAGFVGGAETAVAEAARWEFLVQTQMPGVAMQARLLDATGTAVATAPTLAVSGAVVEIAVPWAALGRTGPAPVVSLSVAVFRENQSTGATLEVGDASVPNAVDVITDNNNPATTGYLDTENGDVSDGVLSYFVDVWMRASGEVYAPLQITRIMPNGAGTLEWVEVQNQTAVTLDAFNFFVGDEETPDQGEGMRRIPTGVTLAPGGRFVIATSGTTYNTAYGVRPDAEFGANDPSTPDMAPLLGWTNQAVNLANDGDEILVVGPNRVIVDVVTYGVGTWPGVTPMPAPALNRVALRRPTTQDTDDNAMDFAMTVLACRTVAACGNACNECDRQACIPVAPSTPCDDGDQCTIGTTCNAALQCVGGTPRSCDDANVCTSDACVPATGCTNTVTAGASCADADACDGAETCDATGACTAGTALDCDDDNPCTADSCDAATGCAHTPVAGSVACDDMSACTTNTVCQPNGTCGGGTALTCADSNPCTVDACNPATGCTNTNADPGTACDDGDACTMNSACNASGACSGGTPITCDDDNPCTADACAPGVGCQSTAVTDGVACDDGDPCSASTVCTAGTCGGGSVSCDDDNPCTTDTCTPEGGCASTPATGTACDDGDECTSGESCNASGVCSGGTPSCDGGSMPDAGARDSGVPRDSGAARDAAIDATSDGGPGLTGGGGCRCNAGAPPSGVGIGWLALAALAFVVRRRRR